MPQEKDFKKAYFDYEDFKKEDSLFIGTILDDKNEIEIDDEEVQVWISEQQKINGEKYMEQSTPINKEQLEKIKNDGVAKELIKIIHGRLNYIRNTVADTLSDKNEIRYCLVKIAEAIEEIKILNEELLKYKSPSKKGNDFIR